MIQSAVNAGKIPFSPWKALSPYPLVYVISGGPSLPWQVNTAIWIMSIIGLLPFIIRRPLYGVYLLIFTICGIVFLFEFPAPYTQYFLPLSVFAGISAAFLIYCLNGALRLILKQNVIPEFIYMIVIGTMLYAMVVSFKTQFDIRTLTRQP